MPADTATNKPRSLEIGIANFKAFGPRLQRIKLKPLTLVFGPNSGGKSSLLHALLWLKDVVQERRLDVYHPTAAGSTVDLGGFKQFRHGNDPAAQVETRLMLSIKDARQNTRQIQAISTFATRPPPTDYLRRLRMLVKDRFDESLARNGLEKLLAYLSQLEKKVLRSALTTLLAEEYGEHLLQLHLDDCIYGREEHVKPLAELRATASPKLDQAIQGWPRYLDGLLGDESASPPPSPPNFSAEELLEEIQAVASAVLNDLDLKPPTAAEAKPSLESFELREGSEAILQASRDDNRHLILGTLDVVKLAEFRIQAPSIDELKASFEANPRTWIFDEGGSWIPTQLRIREDQFDASAAVKELASMIEGTEEVPGILDLCERAACVQTRGMAYLAPLRAYPERGMTVADLPRSHDAEGLHSWLRLYQDEDLRGRVNDWLQRESRHRIEVDHVVHWKQILESVTKEFGTKDNKFWDDVRAAKELDVDHDYAYNTEAYVDAGSHLQAAFDTAFSQQVTSESTATIHLRDLISGKLVSCRDIGLGISQVIPVLSLAMGARDEFIAIEEAEIHVHPALQAQLGDVFIDSALARGNTLLLETHSEHLILRVLKRIRQTTAGEEVPVRITPDDVAVLYVKPGPEGSEVIELPVTPDGDFSVPWPEGFFAERGKELF